MTDDLFSKTPVLKAYMTLAMPVVLSMVVQLIYSMADTFFIALTGDVNLIAGVSICAPLFTLMLVFGDLFGLGGSSVISRLFGAGKKDDGKRLSIFCFYGALATGVAVSVFMLAFKDSLLGMMGAEGDVTPHAMAYYEWFAIGAPFVILSLVPTNLLRTAGQPKTAMYASIVGVVINIILDPVLIFGMNLGAAGAALATVVGYVGSCGYATWYTHRHCEGLSINLPELKASRGEVWSIFSIGLAASVTNLTQTASIIMTNRSLLTFGNDTIAVMGIVMRVVMIAALVVVGLGFGGQPLIGYSYGAKNYERLKETLRFAFKAVIGTSAVFAVLVAVFAKPILGVFLTDARLIEMGLEMLYWQLPAIVIMGAGLVMICTFQSTGQNIPSLILSLCRQGIVYGVVLVVLPIWFGYTGVLAAQLVADVVTIMIAVVLFCWSRKAMGLK